MSFSVTSFIADSAGAVVAIDWSYSNADGTLSNTLKLAMPAGDVPLDTIGEAILLTWLDEQLANTAEEFDAAITEAKQQREYSASLKRYVATGNDAFVIAGEEDEAN